MKNLEITRYKDRLDYLFAQVAAFNNNVELQSHWARYLCILVSGFIETSVIVIYSEYVKQKSHAYVTNYVSSRLERFTNPKMEDILELAGKFSSDWRQQLEITTTDEQKAAVDSIVANRNRIAHGANVGISYDRVSKYYKNIVKVIQTIEDICC